MRTIGLSTLAVIGMVLGGCSTSKVCRHSILSDLVEAADSGEAREANTAALLLAHVALDDEALSRLTVLFTNAEDPLRKLMLAYLLDVRTQQAEYRKSFIELYPQGKAQMAIWTMRSRYTSMPSPLQTHLAEAANTDDQALTKLVSGIPFADGANAESLIEEISALHKRKPQRVKQILIKTGVSLSQIGISQP